MHSLTHSLTYVGGGSVYSQNSGYELFQFLLKVLLDKLTSNGGGSASSRTHAAAVNSKHANTSTPTTKSPLKKKTLTPKYSPFKKGTNIDRLYLTHSFTHSLTYSLAYPLTYLLTHSYLLRCYKCGTKMYNQELASSSDSHIELHSLCVNCCEHKGQSNDTVGGYPRILTKHFKVQNDHEAKVTYSTQIHISTSSSDSSQYITYDLRAIIVAENISMKSSKHFITIVKEGTYSLIHLLTATHSLLLTHSLTHSLTPTDLRAILVSLQ